MVGFYTGMQERAEAKASDRRKTYQLFQDYLNNARTHGLELTEQGMTEFWNQNSGNSFTRNAMPSQARLQSLVEGQNKLIAEKQAAKDLQAIRDNAELDKMLISMRDEYFAANPYVDGDNSGVMDFLNQRVGENALLQGAYDRIIGDGSSIGAAHKSYQSNQFLDNYNKVKPLINDGVHDADTIAGYLPSAPKHIIKQITDQAKTDWDRKIELQNQADQDRTITMRNNAVDKLVALSGVNQDAIDIDGLLAQMGISDPAEIETIKQNASVLAQAKAQQQMETKNASLRSRRKDQHTSNAGIIDSNKKANLDITDKMFGIFADKPNIRNALAVIENTYAVTPDVASELISVVQQELAKNDEWGESSSSEIASTIVAAARTSLRSVGTYDEQLSAMNTASDRQIGYDMYSPQQFKDIVISDYKFNAGILIDQLNKATQSGNPNQFEALKAAATLWVKEKTDELNYRASNFQSSFGMQTSEQDALATIMEGKQVMDDLLNQIGQMQAPVAPTTEKVADGTSSDHRAGAVMEQLKQQKKALLNEIGYTGGGRISAKPRTPTPEQQKQLDELDRKIAGLQDTIDRIKATAQ